MRLIFDCNVLIDLQVGGVLDKARGFGSRMVICDVNLRELKKRPDLNWGEVVGRLGIEQQSLPGEQVLYVASLTGRYAATFREDLFALALARHLSGTLLTGDKDLRRAAEDEGVAVHGTLWVLNELVRAGSLPGRDAVEALAVMLANDRRLPLAECPRFRGAWAHGYPVKTGGSSE